MYPYISLYIYSCRFLNVSLVVIRKWPLCSSLVLSRLISLCMLITLCKSSSDEEVATLLLSGTSCLISHCLYACIFLCLGLVVMRKGPLCSSLVLSMLFSLFLCMYLSLCRSSSNAEVATLLLSSCICLSVCFCLSLVVMRKWPLRLNTNS